MKTLTLVSAGQDRPSLSELENLEQDDKIPRITLFEKSLHSEIMNERYLLGAPHFRQFVYRLIPTQIALLLEALFVSKRYDAIISWPEQLSLPFGLLLRLRPSHPPHVAVIYWISTRKKARLLKVAHKHIDKLLIVSTSQSEFARTELAIPESKIIDLGMYVDHRFWRPMNNQTDLICTSGRELRDYGTLIQAVRELGIRCHIGAVVMDGKKDVWIQQVDEAQPLPEHLTIGYNEKIGDIRNWYSRSRFVVLPLLPSLQAIGSTVILEAMAMGKAVICSRVEGQRDIIEEGKTGLFVPPQDPRALRDAIAYLWNNPHIAEQMGKEGRKKVEQHFTLDQWVNRIKDVVQETIEERSEV